ncbi:MAG TPA: hypothetical protein VGB56_08495 [Flavisolibacter sp.]
MKSATERSSSATVEAYSPFFSKKASGNGSTEHPFFRKVSAPVNDQANFTGNSPATTLEELPAPMDGSAEPLRPVTSKNAISGLSPGTQVLQRQSVPRPPSELDRDMEDDTERHRTLNARVDAERDFQDHNRSGIFRWRGLSDSELTAVINAIRSSLYNNYSAQLDFFRYYSQHDLSKDNTGDVYEALTDNSGDTKLAPHVFGYDSSRLAALLLHERMHGRTGTGPASPYGNPVSEGWAYAYQWLVANSGGSVTGRGCANFVAVWNCGGGEITPSDLPRFRETFDQALSVFTVLRDIIDGRWEFGLASAPFMQPQPMSRATARQLWTQAQSTTTITGPMQSIISWAGRTYGYRRFPRIPTIMCGGAGDTLPENFPCP